MLDLRIQDLESRNVLVTELITLRLILKDIAKTEKTLKLEIKNKLNELEQEKINELKLLEEEIFFMALRNKYLGRSCHITKEEEIDLREHTKKEDRQNRRIERSSIQQWISKH